MVVRWAWVLLGLTFAWAGVPTAVQAQTPVDSLRQVLEEEWSQLLPRWREAGAAADAAREARRAREQESAQVPVDTVRVGPFQLAAVPDQVDMARELFQDIWAEWGDVLSGSEDMFRPWTFLVHRSWSGEKIALQGDSVADVQVSWHWSESRFRGKAYGAITQILGRALPPQITEWSNDPVLSDQRFRVLARSLATAPSFVVRHCYTGDMEACKRSLGLVEGNLAWSDFYTPPERRIVVSRRGPPYNDARGRALWEACVSGQDLSACDDVLEDWTPVPPFPRSDRNSVVLVALRLGGEGAFSRLTGPGGEGETAMETLARTAGVPPDSLLATWRMEVLDSQTSAWAGLARTPLSVLFWFVFFGLLAVRSTRWRLD